MLHLLQVGALLLLLSDSGLTFAKSVLPASPWVMELALLVLMGDLVSPTYRPASPPPRLSSSAPTHIHLLAQILWIHLCLYPHIPPLLNTCPPSAFTFLPHHHSFTSRSTTCQRTLKEIPRLSHNLRIVQWNAGGLSSSSHAELIAFLSGNHYDLILLRKPIFRQPKSSKS